MGHDASDASQPRDRRLAVTAEEVVKTSDQAIAALARVGSQGGVLRIAAGAILDLPAIVFDGSGRVELLAEPGAKRPLLRLRPAQGESKIAG